MRGGYGIGDVWEKRPDENEGAAGSRTVEGEETKEEKERERETSIAWQAEWETWCGTGSGNDKGEDEMHGVKCRKTVLKMMWWSAISEHCHPWPMHEP